MLASERERLENWDRYRINIGINETGEPRGITPVYWKNTATAYNMDTPNLYISKDDLADEEIMSLISKFGVSGCYIFCQLNDYSFLNNFKDIYDLTICDGVNLKDLSFLMHLDNCDMLTLKNAHLKNLDELVELQAIHKCTHPRNIVLYNCEIDDISRLVDSNCLFCEFIVYNPKDRNERERWKHVSKMTSGYYELP